MPKVTFHKKDSSTPETAEVVEREWIPTLFFEATAEILKELQIGDEVEVLVKGKIKGLAAEDFGSDPPEHSFRVEPHSLEVYPVNEFTKLAEEDS